jgi:hypothetical protein
MTLFALALVVLLRSIAAQPITGSRLNTQRVPG